RIAGGAGIVDAGNGDDAIARGRVLADVQVGDAVHQRACRAGVDAGSLGKADRDQAFDDRDFVIETACGGAAAGDQADFGAVNDQTLESGVADIGDREVKSRDGLTAVYRRHRRVVEQRDRVTVFNVIGR